MARLSEFHNWHNDVCGRQDGISDDHVDIATGVTTRFPGGVDGDQAGNDTTRQATQVGLRTVKAGLGGHDDGASGVDEGVGNSSFLFRKSRRTALTELRTFSRFTDF